MQKRAVMCFGPAFHFSSFLLLLLLLVVVVEMKRCPDDCLCDFEEKIADCSDRFLRQPPDNLDPTFTKLIFRNNYLGDLTSEYFRNEHLTHLKELDLSKNYIRKIYSDAFYGLDALFHLNIQSNEISYLVEDSFNDLVSLEYLLLDNNTLQYLYEDTFHDLGKLKKLGLSENKLEYVEPGTFKGMHNLTNLDMSDNSIRTLSPGFLDGIEGTLEILLLDNNKILTIEDGAFKNMSSLWLLSLGNNRLKKIRGSGFEGLVALEYLYISGNILDEITPDTFQHLPKLKSLDLSHNVIYSIYSDAFSANSNLQQLYLSRNSWLYIYSEFSFIDVPSLEVLKLSGNKVRHLSVNIFQNTPNLTTLALDYTYLSKIDIEALHHLKKLKYLSIHDNPLPCDCSLHKIRLWCIENNVDTSWFTIDMGYLSSEMHLEPSCIFPEEEIAMTWDKLKCNKE
ncbi:leucine-rich repeat-containing protein 15-like isoform X1 [Periplaneta americana]|uniref:leucine-rich repeat-containing protein 15-like isoform X1 n=2 Tax=Periplaneta americana TaxID=6978 RepID=UPI0037E916F6